LFWLNFGWDQAGTATCRAQTSLANLMNAPTRDHGSTGRRSRRRRGRRHGREPPITAGCGPRAPQGVCVRSRPSGAGMGLSPGRGRGPGSPASGGALGRMQACWVAVREEAPGRGFFTAWVVFSLLRGFCVPIWFGSVFGTRSVRGYSLYPLPR